MITKKQLQERVVKVQHEITALAKYNTETLRTMAAMDFPGLKLEGGARDELLVYLINEMIHDNFYPGL